MLEAAARAGDPEMMAELSEKLYIEGSYNEAMELAQAAVDAGACGGLVTLGYCYWHGKGAPQSHAEAHRYFEEAASVDPPHPRSTPEALFCLGKLYMTGAGVQGDRGRARDLYLQAAGMQPAKGATKAMINLGNYYITNRPRNVAEAFRWTKAAADAGAPKAQFNLVRMYTRGEGCNPDIEAALEMLVAGATPRGDWPVFIDGRYFKGHPECQTQLGTACRYGTLGVPRDAAAAVGWFRIAADQGYAEAQYELARMYESGIGVPQNQDEASRLYQLARAQGHQPPL